MLGNKLKLRSGIRQIYRKGGTSRLDENSLPTFASGILLVAHSRMLLSTLITHQRISMLLYIV